MVREQAEVAVGGDEGEDPLGFPALEPNTRVEADVVQQPRILGDGGREAEVSEETLCRCSSVRHLLDGKHYCKISLKGRVNKRMKVRHCATIAEKMGL